MNPKSSGNVNRKRNHNLFNDASKQLIENMSAKETLTKGNLKMNGTLQLQLRKIPFTYNLKRQFTKLTVKYYVKRKLEKVTLKGNLKR